MGTQGGLGEAEREETALSAGPRTPKEWTGEIARLLGAEQSVGGVYSVVMQLGGEQGLTLAEEALRRAEAGETLEGEERERTAGGIFFQLSKDTGWDRKAGQRAGLRPRPELEEVLAAFDRLEGRKGKADMLMIKFEGRPKGMLNKGDAVLLLFESRPDRTSVPRGLPFPPDVPLEVRAMVRRAQWERVAETVRGNPGVKLVISGRGVEAPELGGLVVWAEQVQLSGAKEMVGDGPARTGAG